VRSWPGFLHVPEIVYLGDYRLRVRFSDGRLKDVDLSGELHGTVFAPLRDLDLVPQASVNEETGTVEWPTGADLAPEFLYDTGCESAQVA